MLHAVIAETNSVKYRRVHSMHHYHGFMEYTLVWPLWKEERIDTKTNSNARHACPNNLSQADNWRGTGRWHAHNAARNDSLAADWPVTADRPPA